MHSLYLLCLLWLQRPRSETYVHLLTQIITDLPRSEEAISSVKTAGDYSEDEEPVSAVDLSERVKIDHRVLI